MPAIKYQASAGSGKTYTLVLEYIATALSSPMAFSGILCLTYTRAAAAEMRSRILKAIEAIANYNNGVEDAKAELLVNQLTQLFGITRDQLQLAEKVFHNMLLYSEKMQVTTLDAYVNKVASSCITELNLPKGYSLTTDNDEVVEEVLGRLELRLQESRELREALLDYLREDVRQEKGYKHRFVLQSVIKLLITNPAFLDELSAKSQSAYSACENYEVEARKVYQQLKDKANELLEFNSKYSLEIGQKADFEKTLKKIVADSERVEITEKNILYKNSEWYKKKSRTDEEDATSSLLPLVTELLDLYQRVKLARAKHIIYCNRGILPLLSECAKAIADYLSKEKQLLHPQLNARVANLLNVNPYSEIARRLNSKVDSLLIDEYQDTSPVHLQILKSIEEELRATDKRIIYLGDPKQAIFQFAGVDPLQMNRIICDRVVRLQDNYRSASSIVELVNSVLPRLRDTITLQDEDYLQEVDQIFEGFEQNVVREAKGEVTYDAQDYESVETFYLELASKVKERIEAGALPDDVAVLVRKKSEAETLGLFLKDAGVPYVTDSSFTLSSSLLVRTMVAAIKYILDRQNILRKKEITTCLNRILSHELPPMHTGDLSAQVLQEYDMLAVDVEPLASNFIKLLYKILAHASPKVKGEELYYYALLDLTLAYEEDERHTLPDYPAYYRSFLAKQAIKLNFEGKIKIVTIHKAKGLEYPILYLPLYSNRGRSDVFRMYNLRKLEIDYPVEEMYLKKSYLKNSLLDDVCKEEAEGSAKLALVNVLYVALTRARDELHIHAHQKGIGLYGVLKAFEATVAI